MTIVARRVNNDNVTMIVSLALLPPLQRCLACIPCIVMSLATFSCSRPSSLSRCFLACVPRLVRSLAPLPHLPCIVVCWQ